MEFELDIKDKVGFQEQRRIGELVLGHGIRKGG